MEDLCSFKIWLSFFIYLEPKFTIIYQNQYTL
ncbi:hypothetical protein LEP1GSC124_1820, partial [Leptospira interrogans serovar Pyrogenes str. 200701872]